MTKKVKLIQIRIELELLKGLDIISEIDHVNRSQKIRSLIMNELNRLDLIKKKYVETKPGHIKRNGDIEFSKGYSVLVLKCGKVNDEILFS